MVHRGVAFAAACGAALTGWAANADAAVITWSTDPTVTYAEVVGLPGEVNRLSVDVRDTGPDAETVFTDPGSHALIAASPACRRTGTHQVTCSGGLPDSITVKAGDRDDEVRLDDGASYAYHFGVLEGGLGDDRLLGGGGLDRLDGGLGDDVLGGGAGQDDVSYGGPVLGYGSPFGVTASLDGLANDGRPGERDHILGDVEGIYGTDGDDVLRGDDGANYLHPGLGNDRVAGGGGNDWSNGGPGDDTLDGGAGRDELIDDEGTNVFLARDGESDYIWCSATSSGEGDAVDEVLGGCAVVR